MKKKNRRNTNFKNSQGISDKEYLLSSSAGRAHNKELNKDFDYLGKLSPEEFAWMAEFQANYVSGMNVDPEIVGEDNAEILNNVVSSKRPAYNREKRRRFDAMTFESKSTELSPTDDDGIYFHASDTYAQMVEDIEDEIDPYWEEKT